MVVVLVQIKKSLCRSFNRVNTPLFHMGASELDSLENGLCNFQLLQYDHWCTVNWHHNRVVFDIGKIASCEKKTYLFGIIFLKYKASSCLRMGRPVERR